MNKIFNLDNGMFTLLSKIADLMILNMLFLMCCIPIVTIGASFSALYTVTMNMVNKEEGLIVKEFFKAFKENFKRSTIIWIILIVLGILLFLDYKICSAIGGNFKNIMYIALGSILFILAMMFSYGFPLVAKFENSMVNTLKNAIIMPIVHLPYTIMILLINSMGIVLLLLGGNIMAYSILIYFLVGHAVVAYLNSILLIRVFNRYIYNKRIEEV